MTDSISKYKKQECQEKDTQPQSPRYPPRANTKLKTKITFRFKLKLKTKMETSPPGPSL
ncbi:hypothetical protein BGX28_000511 [Mortierella sp. GBA30]|nr:hypothetical protein BGX28_000511 [Mortierella sp. GBA30]